jgi:ADP-ribosylglycohydrolase
MESTLSDVLKARYLGCILGGLVGDTLGARYEFTNTRNLEKVVEVYVNELLSKPSENPLSNTYV